MSNQITNNFVQQFKETLYHLVQQKGSRLREHVTVEMVTGEHAYFDQIGATQAVERTARHSDSPLVNTPHARRRVPMRDFEWGDLIDDQDKVRALVDPTSSYLRNAMWALGRKIDDLIIEAAFADAATGKTGGTLVPFPAGQQIAAAASGLTIDKLLQAKQKLDAAEVDADDPRVIVCSARQIKDLLGTTQITSADYNSVKALAQGEIDTFLGFRFIRSERLPQDGSSNRRVIAFARSGIGLAVGKDMKANVAERPDKAFATYVYACLSAGASRLEEERVVEIKCAES